MRRTLRLEEAAAQTAATGKLDVMETTADGSIDTSNNRLSVSCSNTGLNFLVDTGANVSVLPKCRKIRDINSEHSFSLFAANGTQIKTFGVKTLTLNLRLRRSFKWTFIVADVRQPILGADFIKHFKLLVDLDKRRLIDNTTQLKTRGLVVKHIYDHSIKTIDEHHPFYDVIQKYPDITRPVSFKDTPKHSVVHHIETSGPPVHSRPRPLPPDRYAKVKEEFRIMQEMGICRPSNSPWSSPLHVVPKKDGQPRPCGDYRALNSITKPDRYPIPRIHDFTYLLANKKILSHIDVNRAYHCISVASEDIEKTAIITPFGLYEFPRLSFGLRNAAQSFQRFMDHTVLKGLDFVFCYIDDIIIASSDEVEHRQHLEQVFERFNRLGLTINLGKSEFGKKKINFLGFEVSTHGIQPMPEKVEAISNYPKPKTVDELRRFLGMINFYRAHIPEGITYQIPLNKLLPTSKRRDKTSIQWNPEADEAFEQCKRSLQNAARLAFPLADAQLAIMADASCNRIAGVLQQHKNNTWQPIAYFSKKLSLIQEKYSTYDRELLAIYESVRYFRNLIEGRNIILYTDHKPLVFAFTKLLNNKETPRRIRQLLYISEFTTDIRHVNGTDNVVADALSRIETISCPTTIDYTELAKAQETDPILENLLKKVNSKLIFKKMIFPGTNIAVYCEISADKIRPYLPDQFRRIAFNSVHNMSHPGVRTTRNLMKERFIWEGMNKDVGIWTKTCIQCQKSKVHRHTLSELGKFPQASRFEHIHVDIVGPLPTTQDGYRYLLTIVDRHTGWPEAHPIKEICAETVSKAIYEVWISRFGCPIRITSDQGRQFESNLFKSLVKMLGVDKIRTTPYHPQANGAVERFHRTLKAALMAKLDHGGWIDELATVMLGIRTATRADTGISAAELTYGQTLRLPGDFYDPTDKPIDDTYDFTMKLRETIRNMRPRPNNNNSNHTIFVHPDLKTCSHVFIRSDLVKQSLQPPYEGPYKVLDRNDKVFLLQLPNRQSRISIDRLKPAYLLNSDSSMIKDTDSKATSSKYTQDDTSKKSGNIKVTFNDKFGEVADERSGSATRGLTKAKPYTTRSGRMIVPPKHFY